MKLNGWSAACISKGFLLQCMCHLPYNHDEEEKQYVNDKLMNKENNIELREKDENKKLYERLLQTEREKVALLEKILEKK